MSYTFRLEALRRYRLFQEESLQKALSDVQRGLEQACAALDDLIVAHNKTVVDMQTGQHGKATGPQMAIYLRYLEKLERDIQQQKATIGTIEKNRDHAREALLAAMKKRKTLEKLKENGLKNYLADLDAQELKFINEMAISRHTLKQR